MAQALIGGSSEEYWTMNESLIQQYRMEDDSSTGRKLLLIVKIMTLARKKSPGQCRASSRGNTVRASVIHL